MQRPLANRLKSTTLGLMLIVCATLSSAQAQPPAPSADDQLVLDAREALRKRERPRLAMARANAVAQKNPLAPWVDYWELSNRLNESSQDEVEAFYARWSGSYVEDRLRNDWLLELGRRRDWANFARDFPRFRMNDDREVTCYALLTEHLAGKPVRDAAVAAWLAQREADDGCQLLATTLYEAKVIGEPEVWQKVRLAAETNKPRSAHAAAGLIGAAQAHTVADVFDQPARYLARKASGTPRAQAELGAVALARMAASDPLVAAEQLHDRWQRARPDDLAAWAWAQTGRNAALKQLPEAAAHYRRAFGQLDKRAKPSGWSDDTLAWAVRAELRSSGAERWRNMHRAIESMTEAEQRDPAWQYWKARALRESAREGLEGDTQRQQAAELLLGLSGQLHFYGKLAAEDLEQTVVLPTRPALLTPAEREAARAQAGLASALQLIAIGLRNEGVREWNFSLRGMADRELLAAAQWACEREVWDRCINTSERTRGEIDLEQRFPMPFREEVVARARETGVDPAYVYGLIRQESRFVTDARSSVGASGLMQLMPATARWTANKIGLPFSNDMITRRDVNLRLGMSYLKLLLDDFGGSQALAAAAYNAGPGRPRRWREPATLEAAAWAETIPFNETRDYVKKVLSNAVVYSALLNGRSPALKPRLGTLIGPRDPVTPEPDRELP
jgi:soluble lytic murein transglycosylase